MITPVVRVEQGSTDEQELEMNPYQVNSGWQVVRAYSFDEGST